jgi:hypothetical protein
MREKISDSWSRTQRVAGELDEAVEADLFCEPVTLGLGALIGPN